MGIISNKTTSTGYIRLRAEMMVRGISVSEIAKLLKKSERTVMKKMNCQDADFSFVEVNEIMDTYFPNQSVGYIFGRT